MVGSMQVAKVLKKMITGCSHVLSITASFISVLKQFQSECVNQATPSESVKTMVKECRVSSQTHLLSELGFLSKSVSDLSSKITILYLRKLDCVTTSQTQPRHKFYFTLLPSTRLGLSLLYFSNCLLCF